MLGWILFLIPLMMQILLQKEPWLSGILMLPIALGLILAKVATPYISKHFSLNQILILSQLNFLKFNEQHFLIFMAFGAFQSLKYASLNAIAYQRIPSKFLSYATSVISIQQQLGISLGVEICSILLKIFSGPEGFNLKTFQYNFLILGLISIILLCFILYYLKSVRDEE